MAIATFRLVVNLLYGLSAADPLSLFAAIDLLSVIALFAGYLPARRASLVEPAVALRSE